MQIESSKFPGHPVFHAIDRAWGSDHSVNFNFIPENEAEARMYISGLVPYVRDTVGEWYLNAFTVEAIEKHADSSWDPNTKQVSSTLDAWLRNTLALDEEFNFTDFPTEETPTFQFDVPPFRQPTTSTPPVVRDYDSVSTFHSNQSKVSSFHEDDQTTDEEMEEAQTNQPETLTATQDSASNPLETIHVSTSGPDISGISEDSSRISLLKHQFKTITSNFTVLMEQLTHQTTRNTENQKELHAMLKGIIAQGHIMAPSVSNPDTNTTESSQITTSTPQVDSLLSANQASGYEETAGHGS